MTWRVVWLLGWLVVILANRWRPRCHDCLLEVPWRRARRHRPGRGWEQVEIAGRRFWLCAWCRNERARRAVP